MTTIHLKAALAFVLLMLFTACAKETPDTASADSAATANASVYEAAANNSLRPESDRARDANRKPAEVLEFLGLQPGMQVLDMFSGGGWYAEVMAHVVGSDGSVIAHSNNAYVKFVGDALQERFADERLPQVSVLMAENNQLSLEANSLDAVLLAQSFHDLFLDDNENDWERIDVAAFLAELKSGLKPGGFVAVIDHYATSGAPVSVSDSLHRIDPELVIHTMEDAGFEWDGQSDILRNPHDDLHRSIFDEDLRGSTDRFVIRFRNPE